MEKLRLNKKNIIHCESIEEDDYSRLCDGSIYGKIETVLIFKNTLFVNPEFCCSKCREMLMKYFVK